MVLTIGEIMRLSLDDLMKACRDRKVSPQGSRWILAVRLAVWEDPSIVELCPTVAEKLQGRRAARTYRAENFCQTDLSWLDSGHEGEAHSTPEKRHRSPSPAASPSVPSSEEKAPQLSRYKLRQSLSAQQPVEPGEIEEIPDGPCEVCEKASCICLEKVQRMKHRAMYTLPGHSPKCFLRYRCENNKHLLGCSVCMAFASHGHRLRGRQSLGRFELDVQNPHNHGRDLLQEHQKKSTGDHQRALAWMAERLECAPQMEQSDPAAGAAPKKRPRESVRTTCEEENVILLAYTSLKLGLSNRDYETLARCVHALDASTPSAYMSSRFYREITDCAASCLRRDLVTAVRRSPVLTICCDEGVVNSGFFCIRVHYLNEKNDTWIQFAPFFR